MDTEGGSPSKSNRVSDNTVLSEDDEEEDVEPKLKYSRLGNDVNNILRNDAASCIAVNPKFLVLGTHWGTINLLDHLGNTVSNRRVEAHTVTVNQITLDEKGEYFASCSDDGKIKVQGFYSTDQNYQCNFDRPIKAIAIDPYFYKSGSGRRFATGDEKLILHEKTFFSRLKAKILHEGDGLIRNIKWQGQYIAAASDQGVRVYSVWEEKMIALIPKDHSVRLRPELYRCNLFWKDNRTLLIGWANTVKVCVISRDLPTPYVTIAYSFTTQFYVSGIAPYEDNLVILCCNKEEEETEMKRTSDHRPQLCIIEPNVDDYSVICIDVLSIRGYEEYRCNDYHLEYLAEDNIFYVLSPKDVIVAKPRDEDDHITWLIEHEKFEHAMTAVTENEKVLRNHTILDVGRTYLDHLLAVGEFDNAANLCVKILGTNKKLWEEEVYKFAQINQLKAIAVHLPYKEIQLGPAIYEMVLNEFLQRDYQGFERIIKEWPGNLYSIPTVITAVIHKLSYEPNNPILRRSLGDLYMFEQKYDKAFGIYLRLGLSEAFDLITKHELFKTAAEHLEELMLLNKTKALQLCLENISEIPIDIVVKRLGKRKDLLCSYLDRLFAKDNQLGGQWHAQLVELYAEYDPEKLFFFLKSSNFYPLQDALEICRKYSRVPEQVYLLGRIGNLKQALQLITENLNDINGAIEFCKEYDDKELWDDLITYSLDKPEFIKVLLNNIGSHVDPIVFINRIDNKLKIPGLRDALVKILQDYNLQIALREGCKKILVSDCFSLQERLNKQQKKAIVVSDDSFCHACHGKIIIKDVRHVANILIFNCKHMYHENCLPDINMDACMICRTQKHGPGIGTNFHTT